MTDETAPSCQCETCKRACSYKPGWFLPGEAEIAAEAAGLPLKEFFGEYLAVDWFEADENIFNLSPAIANAPPGDMFPADPRGQCVFFKEGLCSIYENRPFECRAYYHDRPRDEVSARHEKIGLQWAEHQDQIRALLGREPESEPFGILNMLGIGGW